MPLSTRVWWASASPISQGDPACLVEMSGEAPVPPSWPLITTPSACALATPTAITPTPGSEASFTETRTLGRKVLRSDDQLRQVLDRVDVVVREGAR